MDQPIRQRGNNFVLFRDLRPQLVPVDGCKPLGRETRKHPPQQVRKLASSLERFGFVLPVVVDARHRVVAGWGLVLAARHLGLVEVPAVSLTDLSDADLRVLRLALNRIADDAGWDREALALEFSDVLELDPQIDLQLSGFEMGEIDVALDGDGLDEEDELPAVDNQVAPVTRPGDLWILGDHRLLCGNALGADSYDQLLGTDRADMMFHLAKSNSSSGATIWMPALLTSRSIRPKAENHTGGSIIYLGSVHSKEASLLKAPYVTAKHGLVGLAKVVAKEGAKHGVRANVICPGFVRTPLVDTQIPEQAKALGLTEQQVNKDIMLKDTVDGEFTTLEDVAEAAVFFASFNSNALTGQSLIVSNGWSMQ